jgi:hypothetical protein
METVGQKDQVEGPRKDKLAETKKREKELHDAYKSESKKQKDIKEAERVKAAELYKEERAFNPTSKRAMKEEREAVKREEKKENGQMCDHGVWKCKICFPHEDK